MKKLFTLLLAVAASVGTMFAEKVQIGDLYYNLDATNQTAQVTSQNSSNPYWSATIATANIPSSVEYNSVTYTVTSIGEYAFYYCTGLTTVTIGSSVKSIGSDAFDKCSSLKFVNVSDISAWCAIKFDNNMSNPLYQANNLYLNGTLVTNLVIPNS
ncbi:MAG: leucine-rich repeat protein, partial [Paludibacteraceae bacterium]|nr:leucine-rich repeat protein [Paludibacteraceae bacterium]